MVIIIYVMHSSLYIVYMFISKWLTLYSLDSFITFYG